METAQNIPTLRELGYLDPGQLAALLEVKTTTLSNWRAKEFGPSHTKIHGNKIVYHMDEVKRWLAERAATSAKVPTLVSGAAARRHRPKDQRRARA